VSVPGVTILGSREALFDHFVGGREERFRHLDAQRLRCLEVEHCLVLALNRQVRGLGAAQDAVNLNGRLVLFVHDRRVGPAS
jgi:hypothetical protein